MSLWRRYLQWRLRNVYAITSDHEGFTIVNRGTQSARIAWRDIARIVALKRDLYATDLICLFVFSPAHSIEVNEEMEGFAPFKAHMTQALDLGGEWLLQVMFPAFETSETLVFERET